ncbi:crotonase/enoyl-CoA hydratase family protein [Inquilinus sp. CAU 1745]|uniref:crotonase/enoyl-CoA hydratase family protein n=1 Tax=Inquilinus sp. CAU 1745 TaxID=3140369 RepID=UPI00325A4CBC
MSEVVEALPPYAAPSFRPVGVRPFSPSPFSARARHPATVEPLRQAPAQPRWMAPVASFERTSVRYDAAAKTLWHRMSMETESCYTPALLTEIFRVFDIVRDAFAAPETARDLRYWVLTSGGGDVFNLGGDLALFTRLIREQDADGLRRYAYDCIDLVHNWANLEVPMHSIALVQGDALGGGFECALAADIIVAEKKAKFALPEILFNLFPGMGAFNLLRRRLDVARTEKLILSGKVYTAEEMHEMGVVDFLVENGEGERFVEDHITRYDRQFNARQAMNRIKKLQAPISREELIQIGDIWVETALALQPTDLKKMERLVKAQGRKRDKLEMVAAE